CSCFMLFFTLSLSGVPLLLHSFPTRRSSDLPVSANYGLEDIRFIRPLYDGDTLHVRLTCKQKVDRDQKGKVLPSGIVKWYVEVFDTNITEGNIPEDELEESGKEELVAVATILTMVKKKQTTFV